MTVLLAMFAGAIRVSTPFLFVSLGETLTEKSGRINLGPRRHARASAPCPATRSPIHTGSPWLGVLVAGFWRRPFGLMHGYLCKLPKVNDIAIGIALMLFGIGSPSSSASPTSSRPRRACPRSRFGWLGDPSRAFAGAGNQPAVPSRHRCLAIVPVVGAGTPASAWSSAPPATAPGRPRWASTSSRSGCCRPCAGGFLAGIGGAFLSLYYPGSWNEGLSSGQGLMAVALVIFARWNPLRCFWAALLFGAAGALGPALQSVGISQGYYFFNAAPYILTLFIMIASTSPRSALKGAPGELSITK
jgi:ABC-type uncharacterized transport system permease subunit